MIHDFSAIARSAASRLGRTWRAVLKIHITCTLLAAVILVPLAGIIGRLLLALSGRTVATDQDILYFFLSPVGLLALVFVAVVLVAILALEQAALMAIAASAAHQRPLDVWTAVRFAWSRAPGILRLASQVVVRCLLIAVPFLVVAGAIYKVALTEFDINYYLSERPPAFWGSAIAIAVFAVATIIVIADRLIGWSVSLPALLFADMTPRAALARSAQLTKGRRSIILLLLASWTAVTLIVGSLVLGLVSLIGRWFIPPLMDSLPWLTVALTALVLLGLLASLPVGAFNAGSFAHLTFGLYEKSGGAVLIQASPDSGEASRDRARRMSVRTVVLGCVVAGALALLVGGWLLRQARVLDDVLVIAHRGASGAAPENSLAAIERAIDDGADWIEIDVQETIDGEVVVVHDSDFMKLANVDLKVWDGTVDEVRSIDIGSWFSPKFAAERVPTLREVLETARGRAGVVIELKYYGHAVRLEERVAEIVESTGMADDSVVMSLSYDGIRKMSSLRPDWTVGLLVAKSIGNLNQVDADFLAVNVGMATPRFIRSAHRADKQVFVWTVNDPMTMSSLMTLGVDGIITDEPALARQVLAQRSQLSSAERLLARVALLFGKPVPKRTYRDDSP